MALSPEQVQTLHALMDATCWPSLIGTSFVLSTHLIRKSIPRFPSSLFFYFTLSSFFVALSMCISSVAVAIDKQALLKYNELCITQALILQYFASATVYWWFIIILNLFLMVYKEKDTVGYQLYYHAFCWLVSLVLTLAPWFSNKLGSISPFWCWIIDRTKTGLDPVPVFAYFYVEMGVVLCIGSVLWLAVFIKIYRLSQTLPENMRKVNTTSYARHMFLLFWFFVIFVFLFIHRMNVDVTDRNDFWAWCLYVSAVGIQGIFPFTLLGLRKKNYLLYKNFCCCNTKYYDYEQLD